MIDLVYVTHNRRAFTEASLETLIQNTNWDIVKRLHIRDDDSQDGTLDYLLDRVGQGVPCNVDIVSDQFGGPVAAMNHALDRSTTEAIAKIDNDVIVCPLWLDRMLGVMNVTPIDVLGMEPSFAPPVAPLEVPRGAKPAPHVGGVGLFRTSIFKHRRPKQNDRFFGWTSFQQQYARCAWIDPDLPMFLLDHIPVEPWRSLAAEYERKGWTRHWNAYFEATPDYYEWWTEQQVAV